MIAAGGKSGGKSQRAPARAEGARRLRPQSAVGRRRMTNSIRSSASSRQDFDLGHVGRLGEALEPFARLLARLAARQAEGPRRHGSSLTTPARASRRLATRSTMSTGFLFWIAIGRPLTPEGSAISPRWGVGIGGDARLRLPHFCRSLIGAHADARLGDRSHAAAPARPRVAVDRRERRGHLVGHDDEDVGRGFAVIV